MHTELSPAEGVDRLVFVCEQFKAIEQGDMDRLAACFAPGALIWHNYDEKEQTVVQAAVALKGLHDASHRVAYTDQTLTQVGSLVFSKHVLNAELKKGGVLRLHALMQITIDDLGRITRIDEYFDSRAIDILAG